MKIEQKLKLSNQFNQACFIGSGLFCHLYNESAYIVTKLLGCNLKLRVETVKKLNNQKIIVAGIPRLNITSQFCYAQQTTWGFKLCGHYEAQGYNAWVAEIMAQAESSAHHAEPQIEQKTTKPLLNQASAQIDNKIDLITNPQLTVQLTPQQIAYLLTWQKGKHAVHVDMNFLENLKRHVLSSLH